ncbi:MAG: ABC transporter transmembrane domain-containing protein, partial [Phenylobacterium sp.]|nr:ABC transporter transmembrane domain-containing protein [Phenylobacterium sp.]
MEENLQGIRVVRAFSAKAFEMAKFDVAADNALQYSFKRITLRFRAVTAMTLSYYGSMALLLWYGGHQVIAGAMSVGRLTEFLTYMTLLQAPIRQIAMIFASAARATSSGGRVFEVLDLAPEIADAPGARPLAPTQGILRFEHVDFSYDEGRPVLSDVSFEVRPGQTLGVVGAPGSGKSTIANLIPRFYDVTGGKITIDGQDIREVSLASLREYVGLVQQEAFPFDTTVTNNVAYADPWAEEDRIVGAARTAQLHDYIAGLPVGYTTRVGERGVALSGGQRQRMSIARGVVPGPGVMIFDDSTAAIDAVTERKVRDALASATETKATVIIAHRLSSLMHADQIIVLDEGRVVERGDHRSLVAAGGVYAELYALQTRADGGGAVRGPGAPGVSRGPRPQPDRRGAGMSDFVFDRGTDVASQTPRKPRATLGSDDAEEIFASINPKILGRFIPFLKPHKTFVIGAQIAVLISAATAIAIPYMIGQAVNAAVGGGDDARLDTIIAIFVGVVILNAAAFFLEQWMSSRLAQRVIFDVRRSMFSHFQDVSLSFMDKTHVGRIMARLQGDVNALQEFLESTTGAVGDIALLIGITVALLSMDLQLGLLTLTVIPALI